MKADKKMIIGDFINTNKTIFKIPVYQRNYDWNEYNCLRLLDDIKDIIDTKHVHFLGTIVYMPDSKTSIKEYIIIDGQQRLTTIMILLKSLADIAEERGEPACKSQILCSFIYNKFCGKGFEIKLKPIKTDDVQFKLLLEDSFNKMDKNGHIYKNYEICKKYMNNIANSGIKIEEILDILYCKLEIIQIELTKGEDDPQAIFESINSTGLDLSKSDLIRNFLLMDTENQEYLYENYWLPIENELKKGNSYEELDNFFYHYVLFKTETEIKKIDKLYQLFVDLYKKNNYTKESILKELKYYSDIYSSFVFDKQNYSKTTTKYLKNIHQLEQTTCYPFLLHIFDDYNNNIIDENTLNKTLKLILVYLFRRSICDIPTNSLRSLFVYLYNRVFDKVPENKQKYYESINKYLFSFKIDSKDLMPSEKEFEAQLKKVNLYRKKGLCRFILKDIENQDGKEIINVDDFTIEHIMPQALRASWNYIKPEEHEKYLHTIGNLTFTGYNSELSNKNFIEKKEIIIEHSKAIELNRDVIDKDSWNIENIKNRTERLVSIVKDRFYLEEIKDDNINFVNLSNMTLDDIDNVTGKKLISFTYKSKKYYQNIFKNMFQDMIILLDKENNKIFSELAKMKNWSKLISVNESKFKNSYKLRDGLFIKTSLSAQSILKYIDKIMKEFNVDKNIFSFAVETCDKNNLENK